METKISKNIQQYIQLVYSEKSELNAIEDLEERKRKACEKAKLNYDDAAVQKIIHIKDDVVNELIFDHCRTTCPNEFFLLISKQHLLWEQLQMLMEPLKKVGADGVTVEVDEEQMLKRINLKNTVSDKSDVLLQSINELRKQIFKGEQEEKMADQKIRLMRPEDRLKNKKSA